MNSDQLFISFFYRSTIAHFTVFFEKRMLLQSLSHYRHNQSACVNGSIMNRIL